MRSKIPRVILEGAKATEGSCAADKQKFVILTSTNIPTNQNLKARAGEGVRATDCAVDGENVAQSFQTC